MTAEITMSASHTGNGTMPSAPWTRAMRACSRSMVWSIQRSYADCSDARGRDRPSEIVRNISRPTG